MSTFGIVALIIVIVLAIALVVLYILGRRAQKRQEENQEAIQQNTQQVSMLIIDKKKLRAKDSGLPDLVLEQVPWYLKRSKLPIVKAKVGPQIMTFIADDGVFDEIPVKKEVKAKVSGLYITGVKGLRKDSKPEPVKKGFFARHRKNTK